MASASRTGGDLRPRSLDATGGTIASLRPPGSLVALNAFRMLVLSEIDLDERPGFPATGRRGFFASNTTPPSLLGGPLSAHYSTFSVGAVRAYNCALHCHPA